MKTVFGEIKLRGSFGHFSGHDFAGQNGSQMMTKTQISLKFGSSTDPIQVQCESVLGPGTKEEARARQGGGHVY